MKQPKTARKILIRWIKLSSLRHVAKKAKVSVSTLHRFTKRKEITLSTFVKLDKYLRR